eukprot:14561256-Heterocapsa_arctica.AAC.1
MAASPPLLQSPIAGEPEPFIAPVRLVVAHAVVILHVAQQLGEVFDVPVKPALQGVGRRLLPGAPQHEGVQSRA